MATQPTILLVGATGMLGNQILQALLDTRQCTVRRDLPAGQNRRRG